MCIYIYIHTCMYNVCKSEYVIDFFYIVYEHKNNVFVVQYIRRVSWHDFLRGEDGWESKLQSLIQELKRLGRPEKRTCLRAMVLGTSRWESNRNGAWFLEFLQFMILIPKIVEIGTFAWDIWNMKGLSNPMEPFGNIIINTLGEIPWTGWYLQKLQVSIVNLLENHLSQSVDKITGQSLQ